MNRIENIIKTCNECRHFSRFDRVDNNFNCAYICMQIPSVISLQNNKDACVHSIPYDCPLLETTIEPYTNE